MNANDRPNDLEGLLERYVAGSPEPPDDLTHRVLAAVLPPPNLRTVPDRRTRRWSLAAALFGPQRLATRVFLVAALTSSMGAVALAASKDFDAGWHLPLLPTERLAPASAESPGMTDGGGWDGDQDPDEALPPVDRSSPWPPRHEGGNEDGDGTQPEETDEPREADEPDGTEDPDEPEETDEPREADEPDEPREADEPDETDEPDEIDEPDETNDSNEPEGTDEP